MVSRAKRHLVVHDDRAACGLMHPRFRTTHPDEVTCLACAKSVLMHDAHVLQQNTPRT